MVNYQENIVSCFQIRMKPHKNRLKLKKNQRKPIKEVEKRAFKNMF